MGSISTSLASARPPTGEQTRDIIYLRNGAQPSSNDVYYGHASGVFSTGDDTPTTAFNCKVKFQLDKTNYYFLFDIETTNDTYTVQYTLKRMEALAIITQEVKVTTKSNLAGEVPMEYLKNLKYFPSYDQKTEAEHGGNFLVADSRVFFFCFLGRADDVSHTPTANSSSGTKANKFNLRLDSVHIPRFNFPPIKGLFSAPAAR